MVQQHNNKSIQTSETLRQAVISFLIFATIVSIVYPYYFYDVNQPVDCSLGESLSSLNEYDLASDESFGFFDDISDTEWKLHREHARNEQIYLEPDNPEKDFKSSIPLWMLNNVDPIFSCQFLRRVGGRGDGGKWTCDPHRLKKKDDCLVYSVGSAGKYDFEDGLVKLLGRHCEIHVFDPNPKYGRQNDAAQKNIHFHAWGFKSSYTTSPTFGKFKFITMQETMEQLGHTGRRIDIFKIDCEGCEWSSYKDWVTPSIDVRQVLVEIHPSDSLGVVTMSTFFDSLLDHGFVPFSKEANSHPAAKPRGELFEMSFIKLKTSFLNRQAASQA